MIYNKLVARSLNHMVANNSSPRAGATRVRVLSIPHAPESECEKIVHIMATDPRPSRFLKVRDALCTSCSRAIADLFT